MVQKPRIYNTNRQTKRKSGNQKKCVFWFR